MCIVSKCVKTCQHRKKSQCIEEFVILKKSFFDVVHRNSKSLNLQSKENSYIPRVKGILV